MTIVRDSDGLILPCVWDDCERAGHDEIKVRIRERESNGLTADRGGIRWFKTVNYVFCSQRHQQLWLNGHKNYGNLPLGLGGTIL